MLGEKVEFADKHVFLVQLSISLLGEKPAKLHVATFGMADWKLKPSHVLADCSCRLNRHSTHSSCTTVCLLKEKKQGYNLLNGKSVNPDKHESIYTFIVVFISFIHTHTPEPLCPRSRHAITIIHCYHALCWL